MAFNDATRQNIRNVGSLAFSSGNPATFAVPQVGYLAKFHILVQGTMTITPGTGTAALSPKGPWNLIKRLRYEIGAATTLFSCSGYSTYLVNLRDKLGYNPSTSDNLTNAQANADLYAAGVASGANTWAFGVTLPVVINDRDLAGLILLQAQGTVTQLVIEWNSEGGAGIGFPVTLTGNATAAFVGTAYITMETFTVPAVTENQPPLDRIFQTLERVDPIFNTGENAIKHMEDNTYVRLIQTLELNGALNSASVDSRALRYNITDIPYSLTRSADEYIDRRRYTRDMPAGTFVWEFFDQGYPNYGGDRDMIDASGLAEFESVFYINSGATLGSNNNVVRTVQQQLVQLASAPVAGNPSAQ